MLDLLYIDSEAYFQILSVAFLRGKVFDFIKEVEVLKRKVVSQQQS